MLETGGILIVMGAIFALGAAGEGILSLFYRRYLRDTADMGRPGKKLVKLTKLRYETSYYLNGTVHNAKTMVDGMLEHYRLAGLRLWTWHHISTLAAFLCGVMGFAIGGTYVAGRYIPALKERLPLSGMNALIYTIAGAALAAMLIFWQILLDNRTKRRRIESNLVDYFDNEKFHQLGREIALSGRVREIAGDRGRREDPGSVTAEEETEGLAEGQTAENRNNMAGVAGENSDRSGIGSAVTGNMSGTGGAAADRMPETVGMSGVAGSMSGIVEMSEAVAGNTSAAGEMSSAAATKVAGKKQAAKSKKTASRARGSAANDQSEHENSQDSFEAALPSGATGGMTISDIIASGEMRGAAEEEVGETGIRGRSGTRKKTTAASTRSRAKNVQIAQEEMEERRAGSGRGKGKSARDIIVPLNSESSAPENRGEAERKEDQMQAEAAATAVSANLYADAKAAREEELLRLLREYMGL